MPEILFQFLK